MSNLQLFVVRHGSTVWNRETRYQGQKDISLSEEGKEQAAKISIRFQQEPVQGIYTSPLKRALHTADMIAKPHGMEVGILPGMKEIGFGDWEGKPYSIVQQEYAETLRHWIEDPVQNPIPNGECLKDLKRRVKSALDEILARHSTGKVILVGHSGSIRMIFCIVLNMELSSFWRIMQFNGAVNLIQYRNKTPTVYAVNDINHLQQ